MELAITNCEANKMPLPRHLECFLTDEQRIPYCRKFVKAISCKLSMEQQRHTGNFRQAVPHSHFFALKSHSNL